MNHAELQNYETSDDRLVIYSSDSATAYVRSDTFVEVRP
jgi:hypothetical protein